MRTSDHITCTDLPCSDIKSHAYIVPAQDIDPEKIRIIMISEATPEDPKDYFYEPGGPGYLQTTLQAFHDAGQAVASMSDILKKGIYLTTAVKCAKTGYSISTETIKKCSYLLEKEIGLFPGTSVFLLMGDVAIRSINYITKRKDGVKAIPDGSTYKIRNNRFFLNDTRFIPSYLQTGGNYLIEKSKRRMIAEDIKQACEDVFT
jgi:uracil-DNA glycosylase